MDQASRRVEFAVVLPEHLVSPLLLTLVNFAQINTDDEDLVALYVDGGTISSEEMAAIMPPGLDLWMDDGEGTRPRRRGIMSDED